MFSFGQSGDDNYILENASSELSLHCPSSLRGVEVPIYCLGGDLVTTYSAFDGLSGAYQEEESILDSLLLAQWEDRMWKGCFKYDVTTSEIRVIGGLLNFIAQLNQSWSKNTPKLENKIGILRKPSIADSIELHDELLFCVATYGKAKSKLLSSALVPNDSVLVILNETPVDYGHVFLVPSRLNSHLKHLEGTFLAMIVKMAAEINNHSFHLLYDSCSPISTRPYFEACYFPNPLAVESMPVETLFRDEETGSQICAVLDYPIKTLLFESNHNFKALVHVVSRIISQLLELNIAYNLLVSDCGRKIYLFLKANFCSLSAWECAGYFLFNTRDEFDEATEDSLSDLLYGASLDAQQFEMVKQFFCNIAASI